MYPLQCREDNRRIEIHNENVNKYRNKQTTTRGQKNPGRKKRRINHGPTMQKRSETKLSDRHTLISLDLGMYVYKETIDLLFVKIFLESNIQVIFYRESVF